VTIILGSKYMRNNVDFERLGNRWGYM